MWSIGEYYKQQIKQLSIMPSEAVKRILAARHQSGLFNAFPTEKAGPQGPDASHKNAADNKKKKKTKKSGKLSEVKAAKKTSKQVRAYNADHVKGTDSKMARSVPKKQLTSSQGLKGSPSKSGKESYAEANANHSESYTGNRTPGRNTITPNVE